MISVQAALHSSLGSGANVVLFCFEKSKEPEGTFLFGTVARKSFEEAKQDGFEGKLDQIAVVHPHTKEIARFIFVGLGLEKSANLDNIRRAAASAARKVDRMGLSRIFMRTASLGSLDLLGQAATEGVLLGLYRFTAFQSRPVKPSKLNSVQILAKDASEQKKLNEGIRKGLIFGQAVNFVRDAVNYPPSDMDPDTMAGLASGSPRAARKPRTPKLANPSAARLKR